MKLITSSILTLCLLISAAGLCQPAVRISTERFLEAVSVHPGIQSGESKTTFANEFKRAALLRFQHCWMLEQQIREANEYRADILAIEVIDGTLLMKQQLMVLESDLVKSDLEGKYGRTVMELNGMVRHAFGYQPVLPEGCVWSFEVNEAGAEGSSRTDDAAATLVPGTPVLAQDDVTLIAVREIIRLNEFFNKLSVLIALQEKFITKISDTKSILLMQELNQLNNYKAQRWQVLENIAGYKADLFVRTGVLSTHQPGMVSGTD